MSKLPISINMVVRNEEPRLRYYLPQLAHLFDDVVVVVQESEDRSLYVAGQYATTVLSRPINTHNEGDREHGRRLARNEWVLHLDADEEVTYHFYNKLPELIITNEYDAYRTPRLNICTASTEKYSYETYKTFLGRRDFFRYEDQVHSEVYVIDKARIQQLDFICIYHAKTLEEVQFDQNRYKEIYVQPSSPHQ